MFIRILIKYFGLHGKSTSKKNEQILEFSEYNGLGVEHKETIKEE